MTPIARTLGAFVLALGLAGAAAAGPQYVDRSGFALSGYDPVAYFDLEQRAPGRGAPPPVPGRASITAEWNGAVFAFASEANRTRFLADPAAFAPQYDGHCAYGVAGGYKAPGDPQRWRIVEGKLYLNHSAMVSHAWEADIPGQLAKAESVWPGIEPAAPSKDDAPELDYGQAPLPQ